jgi:hypothetical protein
MTTIGIATIPSRERQIERVCRDLSVQADRIVVYANQYRSVPSWVGALGNVTFTTGPDLSDGGKFVASLWADGGYVLTCDDDLLYPPDYVSTTTAAIDRYDRERIVAYHGNVLAPTPIHSYYRGGRTDKVRCLDDQHHDQRISVAGSGVAGWHSDTFYIHPDECRLPCMADLWLAIAAQHARVGMVAIAHRQGWIRQQDVDDTIYDRYWEADEAQTALINAHGRFELW